VTQMTENAAERLDPARAADLTRVLDLQSRWENMRAEGGDSTTHLQALQRAFEAYRVRLSEYTARHRSEQIPDLSPSGPSRLSAWCRAVRAVFRRADGGCDCPSHVLTKAQRLAERIAVRMGVEPPGRGLAPTEMADIIRLLDDMILWCDDLVIPRPSGLLEKRHSHEVGGTGPLE
jgi:hypothetical protein